MSLCKLSVFLQIHQVKKYLKSTLTTRLIFITLSDFEFPGSATILFTSESNTSRQLECFSVTIADDDIVESLETIAFIFGTLDPPAPQVQLASNAMIVIEDNDSKCLGSIL